MGNNDPPIVIFFADRYTCLSGVSLQTDLVYRHAARCHNREVRSIATHRHQAANSA